MRIDVKKSPELQATILALRSVDRALAKQVRQQTKRVAGPEWQKALDRRASSRLEQRVIAGTAVVGVSDMNVRVQAAGKGRLLSGGLDPKVDYPGVEFGSHAKGKTYTRRSRRGRTHRVTRVMGTQFKAFRGDGYVFFPAAKEMIPRLAKLWTQTAVRTIGEALEGKEG